MGQARVLSALPSGESSVQLNLRITDSKLPNTTSGSLLWKGAQGSLPTVVEGRSLRLGKASARCYEEGPETESQTPNWEAFIHFLANVLLLSASHQPAY